MSPYFEQKYKYIVFEPVDSVRSQLKSILKTPWYDIAINLAGKVSSDDTLKLYSKLSMAIEVFGVAQSVSVLTGKLEAEGENTNINVVLRPKHAILLAFYLIMLIFLINLVSLFISGTESNWILTIALFIMLIFIRSLIYFSIGRLKNRFERTMSLNPEI